jgi:hypothetical protein
LSAVPIGQCYARPLFAVPRSRSPATRPPPILEHGGRPHYRGQFGRAEAERLLWRAGFGPRPGEADRLARKGLDAAVRSLTYPGRERLRGPKPRDDKGRPLAPRDAYGHDHLWWLDRMVRTSRPLVERMTLVWHDWFATSNDGVESQAPARAARARRPPAISVA